MLAMMSFISIATCKIFSLDVTYKCVIKTVACRHIPDKLYDAFFDAFYMLKIFADVCLFIKSEYAT